MKKQLLAGAFILASFFAANAQQTISQNNDPDTVAAGGTLGCPTPPNVYSRSFVLADFGITEEWHVTGVEFGLQDYAAGTDVTITLYTSSQAYPGGYPGSLTQLATTTVTFTDDGAGINVIKQVPLVATVPAGSELIAEVAGDFFLGGNTAGSTDPSYLMAEGCGAATPTDVTDIGDFPNVNFLINVMGDGTASRNDNALTAIAVHPNPTTGLVNIQMPNDILVNSATITDVTGKAMNVNVNANTVNISNYASGVYFLNITTDMGSVTRKIVKE